MKTLLILLLFLISPFAYGANTQVDTSGVAGVRSYMTFDTTNTEGANCLDIEGYPDKSINLKITAGTANVDLEFSNDNKVKFADLYSDITVSDSYEFYTPMTHICIKIDSCAACAITASIYATGERRESER